ncbi:hypothetical protein LYY27_22115, partial [Pseudomonas aeruginosa]|uniref:OmpW family outer membrane protein n=1 Tax=Pseudomonas aeruginosa TaxID=287 RepID=UPI00236FF808|nr:hypothetical protein [Pseudomonas aeruginosa]
SVRISVESLSGCAWSGCPSQRGIRTYGGLGVNYTTFFDEDLASNRKAQGFSSMKLQDSWGLAGELGFDYMLNEHALFNMAVWYMDIDTKASINGPSALGVNKTKVDVDVDPWVYMIGFGYKF